jgi:very-short-patch-repair endonuclease
VSRKIEIPNLDNLLSRYLAGEPENKLAAEVGVNRSTFRNRLIEAGITPRNVSGSMLIRWKNATDEQRAAMLTNAHLSQVGTIVPDSIKERQAVTRQARLNNSPVIELTAARMLQDAGFCVTPQKAVGIYNVDIAIDSPPIAVELFGGGWHAYGSHRARFHERTKYLLDNGLNVVIVWIDGLRYPFSVGCVDYVIALAETLRRNPSPVSQYRVILGDGQDAPIRKSYLNTPADIERFGNG